MAYRLRNTSKHTICIDLANGEKRYLESNRVSEPLREELLYGNCYLPHWERQGIIVRLPAKMSEVLDIEKKKRDKAGREEGRVKEDEKGAKKEDKREERISEREKTSPAGIDSTVRKDETPGRTQTKKPKSSG
jgi:hypothetical protein